MIDAHVLIDRYTHFSENSRSDHLPGTPREEKGIYYSDYIKTYTEQMETELIARLFPSVPPAVRGMVYLPRPTVVQ